MYNVNFSRIRGLCRLFHYYFLFIFLISKETKLLCMETINCNANDSSQRTDAKRKTTALAKKSSHTHKDTNEMKQKETIKSFAAPHSHTCWCAHCLCHRCVRVCVGTRAPERPSLCWGRKQWKLYTQTHAYRCIN